MRELLTASDKGQYTEPSKQPSGEYLADWLGGLQLAPSTVASYRKNVRLHIAPYLGTVPLAQLTPAKLTKLYRDLENGGRADGSGGLSARTVRYVHAILSAALGKAVKDGQLARNPAALAEPPTSKQARSPEFHPWSTAELSAFLGWSEKNSFLGGGFPLACRRGLSR